MIAIVEETDGIQDRISGKLFRALELTRSTFVSSEQCADEINIMIGVFNEDFEKAIRGNYTKACKVARKGFGIGQIPVDRYEKNTD